MRALDVLKDYATKGLLSEQYTGELTFSVQKNTTTSSIGVVRNSGVVKKATQGKIGKRMLGWGGVLPETLSPAINLSSLSRHENVEKQQ